MYQIMINKIKNYFAERKNRKQRIAIAKDVLKQLDAHKYLAKTGSYCAVENKDFFRTDAPPDTQFRDVLQGKHCRVCAVGSIFVSCVNLYNDYTVNDWNKFENNPSSLPEQYLKQFFSLEELALMEIVFEQWKPDFEQWIPDFVKSKLSMSEKDNAYKYSLSIDGNDERRMRIIMQNIIDNKGKFVVPDMKARKRYV